MVIHGHIEWYLPQIVWTSIESFEILRVALRIVYDNQQKPTEILRGTPSSIDWNIKIPLKF